MTGPSIKGTLPALPYRKKPKRTLVEGLLSLEKHAVDKGIQNEFKNRSFDCGQWSQDIYLQSLFEKTIGSSQPKAPFLPPQENRKELIIYGKEDDNYYITSYKSTTSSSSSQSQLSSCFKFLPNWKSLQRIIQVPLNSFELKKRNAQNCISLALIKPSNTDPNVPLKAALQLWTYNFHSFVLQSTNRWWAD